MADIQFDRISKSFGATSVLKNVSLDIKNGEFLTLVGPSGCGKSTLLRILAGLETPDCGNVLIDARKVNDVRPAARNLAMVFQSYALYPHLTVQENMLTPLKLRDLGFWQRFPIIGPLFSRTAHHHLIKQVQSTAEILKIEPLLHRKPGELSGGQRQRAALGRAMVRKPVAFLMDEPLSNLDAALRVHMRAELSSLHRALQTTFVYVTHDQAEALTMSDRMAVMMDGEILQLASPAEIYENPADLKVAEFVGSPKINCLPAHIDEDGAVYLLGKRLEQAASDGKKGAATLAIRPEHLTLQQDHAMADFSGTLVHFENLGADTFVHLHVEGVDAPIVVRMATQMAANFTLSQNVHVTRERGCAFLFGRNGKRLQWDDEASLPEQQVA